MVNRHRRKELDSSSRQRLVFAEVRKPACGHNGFCFAVAPKPAQFDISDPFCASLLSPLMDSEGECDSDCCSSCCYDGSYTLAPPPSLANSYRPPAPSRFDLATKYDIQVRQGCRGPPRTVFLQEKVPFHPQWVEKAGFSERTLERRRALREQQVDSENFDSLGYQEFIRQQTLAADRSGLLPHLYMENDHDYEGVRKVKVFRDGTACCDAHGTQQVVGHRKLNAVPGFTQRQQVHYRP